MTHLSAPIGVMNIYATLPTLKGGLALTDTEHDATFWHLLYVASRIVDGRCGRHFYVCARTKRFYVKSANTVQVDDLIEPAQVVEDWNSDGVYERIRHRSEYVLYPLDAEPETERGVPFHVLRAKGSPKVHRFPTGRASVQITGRLGY